MSPTPSEKAIRRINLLKTPRKAPRIRTERTVAVPQESTGMSLGELQKNYETICRAGAIYYPVAYQFLRQLGRGRQGRVFLGLRQGARGCITEHAIKVFDPTLYRSAEEYWTDMGRIASQISQLQRVQSPNLVPRHVYEETYGIGYVQMESIDGIDLRRLLTPTHLAAAQARSTEEEWEKFSRTLFASTSGRVALRPGFVVYILRSVLRGLERLHETNFLHCDIKPGNIMIDRLGYVKVVDFGRAVLSGERISFLLGSPMYMAPETHRREVGVTQSDFYSLGLVALEMLRGEPLAATDITDETELLRIKRDLPDNLSTLLPSTVRQNKYLHSILRRFIDPEPDNRHPTAKDAEAGAQGLVVVDKQFAQAGEETEYSRIASDYLSKLIDTRTDRVELDSMPDEHSEITE